MKTTKNVARFLSEHEFLPITGNQGDMENYIDNVGFRDEIYNMMVGIMASALGIFIILYFIYDTRKNEKKQRFCTITVMLAKN